MGYHEKRLYDYVIAVAGFLFLFIVIILIIDEINEFGIRELLNSTTNSTKFVEWLVAIGTLSAATTALVVAIFGEYLKRRWGWLTPELSISLNSEEGEKNTVEYLVNPLGELPFIKVADVRYFHIKVGNKNKYNKAEGLSIEIIDIIKNGRRDEVSGTFPLIWWYGENPIYLGDDNTKLCDLGFYNESEQYFMITSRIRPTNKMLCIGRDEKFELKIRCFAKNASSNILNLKISLTGNVYKPVDIVELD